MILGIDARPLGFGITGNSRYLADTLKILLVKRKDDLFLLFSHKPLHPIFREFLEFPNLRLIQVSLPGPIFFHLALPFLLKHNKVDKFWGTLQMLPAFYFDLENIVNYHDLNFLMSPETMPLWNFWQHKLLSPQSIGKAGKILCLSRRTEKGIHKYFPKSAHKTIVVYPGVKIPSSFDTTKEFPTPFFLSVGTLEPRKNLKMLINAFLMFQSQSQSTFSLLILGRKGWGKEGKELLDFLQSSDALKAKIIFWENPSDATLSEAYRRCSAFFFPSLNEGFGLPLLEAMQADKCCAASKVDVFEEILEPESDLFALPNDTEAWTRMFHYFLNPINQKRKNPFSKNKWSWERTAQQIEDAIWN